MLKALGHTLRRELGGSSGPLYGVLFLRCGNVLASSGATGLAQWAEALDKGCVAISELGGAKLGDRTMLDALDPFVKTLKESVGGKTSREAVVAAVEAAERGVEATAQMKPVWGGLVILGIGCSAIPIQERRRSLSGWVRPQKHSSCTNPKPGSSVWFGVSE
jgi:dihydroxyacetone kinase